MVHQGGSQEGGSRQADKMTVNWCTSGGGGDGGLQGPALQCGMLGVRLRLHLHLLHPLPLPLHWCTNSRSSCLPAYCLLPGSLLGAPFLVSHGRRASHGSYASQSAHRYFVGVIVMTITPTRNGHTCPRRRTAAGCTVNMTVNMSRM